MTKQNYTFYKSAGICVRCHQNPAEPNRVMCAACAEKERQSAADNRKALKEMGICPYCGQNKIFSGESCCPECAAKKYISNRVRRNPAYDSQYQHDRKERLKSAGICIKCGKRRAVAGKTKCGVCAASERIRAREYRQRKGIAVDRSERSSYGKCYFCGEPVMSGKRVCEKCREKCVANLPDPGNGLIKVRK